MTLGGYIQTITTFVPVDESFKPFPVLVFVATAQSKHWLGPACASSIAKQVKIVPIGVSSSKVIFKYFSASYRQLCTS